MKTDRREFLKACVAGAVLPGLPATKPDIHIPPYFRGEVPDLCHCRWSGGPTIEQHLDFLDRCVMCWTPNGISIDDARAAYAQYAR